MTVRILAGDCVDRMGRMPDGSVGAVCCDPPYGLMFMGAEWDRETARSWHRAWLAEAFRILRSGGVAKVMGATRTFHRVASAMTDVGFTSIRVEAWTYSGGFPKSWDVGKLIEALELTGGSSPQNQAVAREMTGQTVPADVWHGWYNTPERRRTRAGRYRNAPGSRWDVTTENAKAWSGWGTGLRPSWEPVVVGRKP